MPRLHRLSAVFLLLAAALAAPAHAGKPYQYYAVGDPTNVVLPQPKNPAWC